MRTKADKPKEKEKNNFPFFNSRKNTGFFNAQTKLNTGKPNDKYEQEADKVADSVVRNSQSNGISADNNTVVQQKTGELIREKPLAESITPLVQKQEEEEQQVQAKAEAKEEEEMVQAQVEEEMVQTQVEEEEEMVQAQAEEEEESVQMQEEEEEVQAKAEAGE